jgi:hypothetical protein
VSNITEPPLPDTSKWQPRKISSEPLKAAFLSRCLGVEKLISLRVQLEKEMNMYNFDSGPSVEEIIRDEFGRLLPNRYSVRAGTIVDQEGSTGGDCDLTIFNDFWFPVIKSGAVTGSRKVFLPIDGVYAVGEIKQTLDFNTLDDAMEKLVTLHRLNRPPTNGYRMTENQDGGACFHTLTNPLYSMIIATSLKPGVEVDSIVKRFVSINKTLKRLEIVSALCILGYETVTWGWKFKDLIGPTIFQKDLYLPLVPVRHNVNTVTSVLYALVADLLLRLNLSILPAEDIANRYGIKEQIAFIPTAADMMLEADEEWLSYRNRPCSHGTHDLDI